MTRPPAPPLTPAEREVVARFEAAEAAEESWGRDWDDVLAPGTRVEVHEIEGGYVVFPLDNLGLGGQS